MYTRPFRLAASAFLVTMLLALMAPSVLASPLNTSHANAQPSSPLICTWSTVASASQAVYQGSVQVGTAYAYLEEENTACSTGIYRSEAYTVSTSSADCWTITEFDSWLTANSVQTGFHSINSPDSIGRPGSCSGGTYEDLLSYTYRCYSGTVLNATNKTWLSSTSYTVATTPNYTC